MFQQAGVDEYFLKSNPMITLNQWFQDQKLWLNYLVAAIQLVSRNGKVAGFVNYRNLLIDAIKKLYSKIYKLHVGKSLV